jgi:pilus assembly protein Flp/PilA
MKNTLARSRKDPSGAKAIEYGLIAALIGIAIVAGATALATTIDGGAPPNSAVVGGP